MNEMQAKIEKWMELLQLEQLEDVLEDIQMSIRVRPDSKLNDSIFKLLIRLCRVTEKCNEQNCETGKSIAKLTKLLCSLLIEVPHNNNFVKVIFKIVQCLINFNLHDDAAEICCYLQPGDLYNPQGDTMNLLIKVLSLWRVSVNNVFHALTKSLNTENYNKLKSVIKHEMKMVQIAYKDYTKHLITEISVHLDRLAGFDRDKKYFDDFCKYTLEYLSGVQLYLDEDEKHGIYGHVLGIICHVICRTVNTTGIESAVKTLDELSNYFETLLAEDNECYQCFQQFQNLCTTLLVPKENLGSDSAKNIQNVISCNLNIAQKYGYAGLEWNAHSIGKIVDPMFTYWENCMETDEQHMPERLLDTGILLELMNLFIHLNTDEFYVKQTVIKCNWCLDKLCTVKRNLYNATVMKCRCISLVCKFPAKTLPAKVCALAREILEQNVKSIIREIGECECKRWTQSWNTCRNLIYNVGVLSEHVYEESERLYSFLCTCIFQLEGIELSPVENSKNNENIISLALHRLSVVHYKNNMYRKAMTACALNALLTCNQSKTKDFHIWTNIKKNAPEEIANFTMLECLTNDKDKIKNELGFSIDTFKSDFTELCLCEARNLLKEQITFTNGIAALLEKLQKLQSSNQYAHTVQLLGYYFLGFKYDSSILKYHEQAIRDLKQDKSNSVAVLCLESNLSLFTFLEELHVMSKQTLMEMQNTQFALYAPKLRESAETNSPNVVSAYTMINVKKDTNLMLCLQKSLKKWKLLFKCYFKEIVKHWEPNLVLRMLITAGEYARLYRYEDCEAEIWTLAYELASEMNDYAIIYITGRCISLRQINYDWIIAAKQQIVKQRNSEDESLIGAIAIFWISLADLYFECGKYDDAKQLLNEVKSLSGVSFLANISVHLLSLDVIIRNHHFYKDDMQHKDYSSYLVESLYAVRSLNQNLLTKCFINQAMYLFSYDVLFTMTVNLSIRINSLLSFRGINPDLVRVLMSAQSLNAMLRTAELLKSLCYIDLSRLQLDDCEVKLQDLEHMLNIETFQLSMESKPVETFSAHLAVTPTKIIDPVRNTPQYDASPVLGKKVFDLPKFTLHTNCDCYNCGNVSYQYLVFITTYIRAQLYALQNHPTAALDHFHGAFEIRRRLFEEEKSVLPENWPRDEIGVKQFSWQIRFYITDYIQLLIDFCYFLKTKIMSRQEDALDLANLAMNMCYKYKLEGHPIYVMAKELTFDNELQPILESLDFSKFTVSQPHDIDISDYVKIPIDPNCVTPAAQNHRTRKPLSLRHKKNPVTLKITKVNMIWSDDEDDDLSPPPPPPSPTTYSNKKIKSRTNLVKRKIFEEDLADDLASLNIEDSASKETKLENVNDDKNSTQRKSIRDIMIKVTSVVPDISKTLMNLLDKLDLPATIENIDKLIENVESLKISSNTRRKSVKDTKHLTVADYNRNINQAIELLKNMAIKTKTNDNTDSSTLTKPEKVKKLQDQKIPEIKVDKLQDQNIPKVHNEKKFFKTKSLKESIEKTGTLLTNECKSTRNKCPKLLENNEDGVRTRSSLRRSQKEKPS